MKEGDIAKVLNDDGGHLFKGVEVIIERILSDKNEKPVLVRSLEGRTESFYKKEDLEVIKCKR